MPWKKLLAWATGQIDEALRQKLEFVLEENRVYRALLDRHSPHRRLQDAERKVLADKGKALGKLLHDVITIVQPETLLKWHRRLSASKWDFSHRRKTKPGRPAVSVEIERLVLQVARENPGWGYDRIAGALANPGHRTADQTIGNILMRHGLGPAPERKRHTTWIEFIRRHKAVLWATDFFTAEVWTSTGLTTCYVLFFLHLQTRRVMSVLHVAMSRRLSRKGRGSGKERGHRNSESGSPRPRSVLPPPLRRFIFQLSGADPFPSASNAEGQTRTKIAVAFPFRRTFIGKCRRWTTWSCCGNTRRVIPRRRLPRS